MNIIQQIVQQLDYARQHEFDELDQQIAIMDYLVERNERANAALRERLQLWQAQEDSRQEETVKA